MCKILYPLLLSILFPILLFGQKPVQKQAPAGPVTIMTQNGPKVIATVPGKLPSKRIQPKGISKKKVATAKTANFYKDYLKVSEKVNLKSTGLGGRNEKEVFIYYPSAQMDASTRRQMKPQGYFATVTLSSQSDVDNFNTTYPSCTSVGTLTINGATINNITNLAAITDAVMISVKNTALTNLSSLSALTTISDSLVLENNASLTSIGLSNVSTLGGLILRNLSSLTTVDAFSNMLSTITHDIKIESVPLTSLGGLSAITTLGGDLSLINTQLTSASQLNGLTNISYLELEDNSLMQNIGLTNLQDLDGVIFQNMPLMTSLGTLTQNLTQTSIGTIWIGNMAAISDISGLSNITSVANIIIYGNDQLENLQGLDNIGDAMYGIFLYNNSSLNDITALSQITTVANDKIEIAFNNNLSSLAGLESITEVDALWIYNNNSLTDLNSLNANLVIHNMNGDDLQIYNNPNLSLCAMPAICNYLSSGNAANPQIYGNTGDCSDLPVVQANCGTSGTCPTKNTITWNGSVSDDWSDAQNWTPNQVPDECSVVIIPSGTDYEPYAYDDISIGGLKMQDAYLYMNGYNLTVTDTFKLSGGYIDGYGDLKILHAGFPEVNYSTFYGGSIQFLNLKDSAFIYGNEFNGEVTITDHASRVGMVFVFGNTWYGNTALTNNSDYGNFYLANGNAMTDYFYGNLTINNNSTSSIPLGLGNNEPLYVEGNVTINQTNPNNIYLDKITFGGSNFQQLIVPQIMGMGRTSMQRGPVELGPFEIKNIFFRKYGGFLFPDQDIMVTQQLVMGNDDGIFGSQYGKMLIIGAVATVLDEDEINGSFVEGPMKKIGNTAFTFPLGKTVGMAGRTGNQPIEEIGLRRKELYGDFKAPLSISAPSETTAEFVAEYKRSNMQSDGYDPGLREPAVDGIIPDEYWILNRERGSSNVAVTLSYDKNRVEVPFAASQLNITGWNGTQWMAHAKGATTGDNNRGTITTGAPLTQYGPLAFFAQDIRTPILTIQPLADTIICKGSSFKVHFTLDTAALEGTIFRVVMSDENGDFSADLGVGSKTTFVSDSITLSIPASWLTTGSHYLLKITGDRQAITSQNTIGFTVVDRPQVAVSITGPAEVCLNTGVAKYYPSEKEAGVTYNWTVSGGTFTVVDDTAFVTFTATGNRNIQLTPSNKCGNGQLASRTIVVKPGAPVTAPVLNNTGRWIQTSTPPPAENVTAIKWYKNGSLIPGENGNKYYASEAGTITVEFANDCGSSPVSNTIVFSNASQPQTITFNPLPNKTYGDEPFSLAATSSSGLPVMYQLMSGPGNITEGVFTITKSGTVVIKAYQQGDNDYDTAVYVTQSFTIAKAVQTIVWDSMPDYHYSGSTLYITLPLKSSGELPISYQSTSPNVSFYGNQLRIAGLGSVSITGSQAGDANYLPATPVTHTFCVSVAALTTITGAQYVCPGQEAVYKINKIPGLVYSWRLSDGTNFSSDADTVEINWAATGSYTLYVSATGPCGPATAIDSLSVTVMDGVTAPVAVSNMLPADGSIDQKLPLVLSWIPGNHTLSYDVFIWENGQPKPASPFAANLTQVNYTIARNSGLIYDKIYNWQVIAKNGCLQTAGAVQTFRLRKATDLAVTQVLAPLTVNSGQNITINWTVKNMGPGNTLTNEQWTDAVFLSFDTIPTFMNPALSGISWSILDFPVRPLLIGTKPNVTALNAGESYTNTIDFNIPLSYSQPLYVYVIADYKGGDDAPPQSDFSNDTARQQQPINVVLTPTPDLRVDTLLTPATTFSGSKINVTYQVKNYGALTPSGSTWNDKIYISKSPLFVKKNAIQLEFPNQNEMYYPAKKTVIANSVVLQTDSSATRSVEVIIPNFISGTWFIHVVTNEDGKLYEGALAENNETNKAIQIILTPTPQFTINTLNVPVTNLSTTQTAGINWNVFNAGFYDNIEKNKGFYGGTRGLCSGGRLGNGSSGSLNINARDGGSGTATVTVVPKEFDSLSWGSSYWLDKVYLSTDPSGLNTGTALFLGEVPKGIKNLGWQMPLNVYQNIEHCTNATLHNSIPGGTTSNVLRPGSNHPNSFNFKVPANLPDGDYYFYVQTNATNTVFTYIDTPVVSRSVKVTISRPDLSVPALTVPAAITGGTPFTISYTVQNNGQGGVLNTKRTDRIYMSNSSVYDGSAQLIKTVTFTEDVISGTPVSHSVEHTLPNDISGTKYFFVRTNADSAFAENNFNNNLSPAAMASVSTAAPVDLVVNNVTVADTSFVPGTVMIQYSVQNNGANAAIGETVDSVYISCSPVFNYGTAIGVGARKNSRNISAGNSVEDTVMVNISIQAYRMNPCFAKADFSKVYFHVKANTGKSIYEAGDTTNNVGGSGEKTFANMNLDFEVSGLSGPDNGWVGRDYSLSWTLKNLGLSPNLSLWVEQILFSTDSSNTEDAVAIKYFRRNVTLAPSDSKNFTANITIPKMPTGDYFVMINIDPDAVVVNEVSRDNNKQWLRDENGKALKVHIVQPLLSDLTSEITVAPASIAVGQPLTMKFKVTNEGTGITYPDKWTDRIWLSKNLRPSIYTGDVPLITRAHSGNLEAGQFYEDSITVNIPLNTIPGNYLLIADPDNVNRMIELNDTNNLGIKPIVVYVPEPVDLVVTNVTSPDTVYLGYLVDSVKWHVQNLSSNQAEGITTDGIYLSKNPVYDSSAVLIGLKNKNIKMSALATDTIAFAPVVSNVPEGNYYIIVRTDLLNNISETDKTNNDGVTALPVFVSVKELRLDETLPDTMSVPRYYKLVIPDSLLGATVLVTLKSEDSLTMRNEMYVGGGYIPSVLQWDYKFNTPNYGNQQILVSDITQPVYYISVRPVSQVMKKQNITMHATRLPFAVLMSQTNRGGNGGNVTVKLTGSLFTDSMTAKLVNGGTTIVATKIYFINSTVVYATFPLQGKSLGVYDIVLTKTDNAEAMLEDGFSVVSPDNGGLYATGMNTGPTGPGTQPGCDPGAPAGLNSQLVTELVVPDKVFAGWPFVVQINFSNPTNMDIPVQTKVLYNDYNIPMAFKKEDTSNGSTSLFIEISESDGPPGVIRAGSSGTITIYTNTPPNAPAHDRIKFNLK